MKFQIEILPNGESQTALQFQTGDTPVLIGIQLASATRVVAKAFCAELRLPSAHEEIIEASIVESYERDMKQFGALGENVRKVEGPPSPEP